MHTMRRYTYAGKTPIHKEIKKNNLKRGQRLLSLLECTGSRAVLMWPEADKESCFQQPKGHSNENDATLHDSLRLPNASFVIFSSFLLFLEWLPVWYKQLTPLATYRHLAIWLTWSSSLDSCSPGHQVSSTLLDLEQTVVRHQLSSTSQSLDVGFEFTLHRGC